MMNKTVIGSYESREEALHVVDRLVTEGYTRDEITLYANSDAANLIGNDNMRGVEVETSPSAHVEEHDESLWERIKDAFSVDTRDSDYYDENEDTDDILLPYRTDLGKGNIIVAVENYKGMNNESYDGVMPVGRENDYSRSMDRGHKDLDDEQSLKLKKEELEVDKNKVQTGEVDIHKRTVTETKTVDIPVEHEEVVIERHQVKDGETVGNMDSDFEDIHIPISEEQIEITKKPVVSEEVTIHKEKKHETKHVSEEVKREELDVDTEGDVHVEGANDDVARDYDSDLNDRYDR